MTRQGLVALWAPLLLLVTADNALGAEEEVAETSSTSAMSVAAPRAGAEAHRFDLLPTHHFTWAATDGKNAQVGVNFGLLQLALGGFNVAAEVRYRRWWFEYSHGVELKLNDLGRLSMTGTERSQNLRIVVPYTTGFGVGATLVDELWIGVEFKTHKYEVNAPQGPVASYQTYSVGPVLGYKAFLWRGLYANVYARYWPNVATSLDDNKITLQGTHGAVTHDAHDFEVFANVSIGYAIDL